MTLERNVFGMLDRTASSPAGSKVAFSFSNGEPLTFVDLRDTALGLAQGLVRAGLRPGDRVAVMMNNRREWVEVFFGLAAAGLVGVPVNIFLVPQEIDHVLRDSGARALVFDDDVSERVVQTSARLDLAVQVGTSAVPAAARATLTYESILRPGGDDVELCGPDLHDPFMIYYTSGTTGSPKGAVYSHGGVLWNSMGQWNALGLDASARAGVLSSLSWTAGFHVVVLALVWAGGSSHIRALGGATPRAVTEMLVNENVTHTFLVPSLLAEMIEDETVVNRLRDSALRWVLTGSAPVPLPLLQKFRERLPDLALCQGYGFTEFPPVVCVLEAAEARDHEGSAGRPMAFTQVAVRRGDDTIAQAGSGELLVRSLATMIGYHGKPQETEQVFRDGWYHTGDLVDIDEDGYVTITGRLKDMIISGGLNVYPKEVEDIVLRLDGIRECAVVGVPDEKFGETVAAVVVVDDPSFDTQKVSDLCRESLAGYKRPRHVLVRTEPLPRNANAKILKRDIAPWAISELERRTRTDVPSTP